MLLALIAFGSLGAQATKPSTPVAPRPPIAISAIREADLRRDLYALGGDEVQIGKFKLIFHGHTPGGGDA